MAKKIESYTDFELASLPDELKKQLRMPREKDNLELKVQQVFSKAGEPKDANDIILQLFSTSKKVYERQSIQSTCGKLVKQGILKRVKQGVYSK